MEGDPTVPTSMDTDNVQEDVAGISASGNGDSMDMLDSDMPSAVEASGRASRQVTSSGGSPSQGPVKSITPANPNTIDESAATDNDSGATTDDSADTPSSAPSVVLGSESTGPVEEIGYVPDLLGLARLAHRIWTELATKNQLVSLSESFSEACFTFAVLQIGCLIVMRKARIAGILPQEYHNCTEISDALDGLEGMLVPQFLIDFSELLGSARLPNNAQINVYFPKVEPDDLALRFERNYSTSIPPLRVLARVIRNQVEGRVWNDFTVHGQDPLLSANTARLYPGLQFAPAKPTKTATELLCMRDVVDSIEYVPAPGARPTPGHYLQLPPSSPFHKHLQTLFSCCKKDGLICAELKDTALLKWGRGSLQYVILPTKETISKAYWVYSWQKTTRQNFHSEEYSDARKAKQFQVLLLKRQSQIVFAEENSSKRWPKCWVLDRMHLCSIFPFSQTKRFRLTAQKYLKEVTDPQQLKSERAGEASEYEEDEEEEKEGEEKGLQGNEIKTEGGDFFQSDGDGKEVKSPVASPGQKRKRDV
eukprot:jgi/Botrbrau1/11192/Bobra.0214s0017.1